MEGLTLNLTEDNLEDIMTLSQSMSTEDHLKNVAKRLYDKSLRDQEFAKYGACICDRLSNVEVQGSKFRNVILKFVQEDFKGKGYCILEFDEIILGCHRSFGHRAILLINHAYLCICSLRITIQLKLINNY